MYDKIFIPGDVPQLENPLVSIEVAFWKQDKVPNSIKLVFRHGPPRVIGHPLGVYTQRLAIDVGAGEVLVAMRLGVTGHRSTSQIAYITVSHTFLSIIAISLGVLSGNYCCVVADAGTSPVRHELRP